MLISLFLVIIIVRWVHFNCPLCLQLTQTLKFESVQSVQRRKEEAKGRQRELGLSNSSVIVIMIHLVKGKETWFHKFVQFLYDMRIS